MAVSSKADRGQRPTGTTSTEAGATMLVAGSAPPALPQPRQVSSKCRSRAAPHRPYLS